MIKSPAAIKSPENTTNPRITAHHPCYRCPDPWTHDAKTCDYVEKRRAEGKTDKEIRRCVKRYLARRVFRILATSTRAKRVQEAA
ncbi:hypothetical protein GCM10025778_04280 [Paeniglutamicibacter antarcticus]|uniref:Transposase n=1 Tax=Paeniglutamicibacter antarcticus TaxID=494023 RepID=A0ABP9TJB3_9MICC